MLIFGQSVKQRKLITSDISLSGAYVYFDTEQLNRSKDTEQTASLDRLSSLVLTQISQFRLSDSHVTYSDGKQEKKFALNSLNWLNNGNRHQASGKLILEGLTADEVNLQADLTGEHFKQLSGQIFLAARKLNITPWIDKKLVVEHEQTRSDINFDSWISLKNGRLQQLQIEMKDSHVNWLAARRASSIKPFCGQCVS